MQAETRRQLKTFILDFARRKVKPLQNVSVEELRRAFPFHDLFFRDEALLAFKRQRSIVTSLGRGFTHRLLKSWAGRSMPKCFVSIHANVLFPHFPEHYRWPFTKQIMDMETEVLIGGEFWDFVGGPGTYDELLCILSEVKQELRVQ